jgi:hypothetical protein
LEEPIKDVSYDTTYGIATVEPNRAIKKCRIRRLRIEYFTSDIATVLTIPRSCGNCERMDDCTDDFILQIMEKSSASKQGSRKTLFFS